MEHIAAIAVIAMTVMTLSLIARTHTELVLPARDRSLAQSAAVNLLRAHAASGVTKESSQMGAAHYTARLIDAKKIRVDKNGATESWTFTFGVHDN